MGQRWRKMPEKDIYKKRKIINSGIRKVKGKGEGGRGRQSEN